MNRNKPLFSIATPCWNSVSTIERTIKSILEQDFKDYEYIIVDGGSTDGTLEIIKKYEPLFEGRMSWNSEPDKGIYDAFNKGIERSRGLYCWNVNADDYLEPDALANLAEFIKNGNWGHNLPVISGILNFVSRDGSKVLHTTKSNEWLMKKSYNRDHIGVPHPATLVPRVIYEKYGSFDIKYKIMGDTDWFHRVYKVGVPFVFIECIITNMADGGVSNLYKYKQCLGDRIYYYKKFYLNPIERLIRLGMWTVSFYKQRLEYFFMN
ncbi:glycosyltransferase family 2 protein [Bacteroides acidifaciens]|uniref:glycosyltransferase family 2 protein n=1 Tax=Bacteroides acidifaciens TaxID=85831 RepID=UPI00259597A2|nr:glycosyltransferase family 2 protein [Bacteroides acidifaciens]